MEWSQHIHRSPEIMLGKPVFKGTRLTVQHVLERLGDGATEVELLAAHPRLTPDHIRAALSYAGEALSADEWLAAETGVP